MQLVEHHIIKKTDARYKILDEVCFKSKNLYNAALYEIRQHFFDTKQFLNWLSVDKLFKEKKQDDYYSLPCKVSQQTLKLLNQNFKSFFSLLKKKNYTKKKSIPKYLDKVKGRFVAVYTNQAISKKALRSGIIQLSGTDFKIRTKVDGNYINQVRIVPKNSYYKVEVVYEVEEIEELEDNGRYAAIDLGVNNLATVSFNTSKPFIINGKPLKSINQFYNKRKAELSSILQKGEDSKHSEKHSKKLNAISAKRDRFFRDYFYKISHGILRYAVENDIDTIVVGKNQEWKQNINNGKKNNQAFVSIPFAKFTFTFKLLCAKYGIQYIETEESYTSKASFLDGDEIPTYGGSDEKHTFSGRRVSRGIYKSSDGTKLNADINGASNIIRKTIPTAFNKIADITFVTSATVWNFDKFYLKRKCIPLGQRQCVLP